MALTVTAGASGGRTNTGSPGVAYPAPGGGVLSTDLLVLFVMIHKASQAGTEEPATEAGWTLLGNLEGGNNVASGADVGLCRIYAFWRLAAGGETGSLTLTINNNTGGSSGTNAGGRMFLVRADSTAFDSVALATGSDNTGGAALSVTFSSNPGITSGDKLLLGFSAPTDTVPGSGLPGTLAAASATINTITDAASSGGILGLDGGQYSFAASCSAGTATAAPTWTGTLGTTNTNFYGPAALVRVREGAGGATGTLATTLDDATLAASGEQTIEGTLATTLDDATMAATGTAVTLFVADFEVAPDATGLTAVNTGFDTVAHTGTAVSDDDVLAPVGTYAARMDVASGQTCIFRRNFTLGGANGFSWFGRFDAFPPAIGTLAQIRSSTTVRAQVRLNTDGTITLRNANTTPVVTSTLALPTGQWWRIDWKLDSGTGLQHYAMYVGANLFGTTPDETGSGTYNTGTADNIHWGTVSDVAGTWTVWGDYFQAVDAAIFPTPPTAAPTGTLATTLDDATLAAAGTVSSSDVTGTLATTLDGATLAASGGETFTGTLASTLDGATLAASGTETITGPLGTTLADATLAASGTETLTGAIASTLDDATLAASGAVANPVSGTLAATLDGASLAAVGTAGPSDVTGSLATTLDSATLAAVGTETIPGTLAAALDDASLASTGTVANPVAGTLATTLDDAVLAAAGAELISGALAAALDGATLAGSGVVASPVFGTLNTILDGASLVAAGLQMGAVYAGRHAVTAGAPTGTVTNTSQSATVASSSPVASVRRTV